MIRASRVQGCGEEVEGRCRDTGRSFRASYMVEDELAGKEGMNRTIFLHGFIGTVSYFFLLPQLNVKTTYLLMNKLFYNILDLESN